MFPLHEIIEETMKNWQWSSEKRYKEKIYEMQRLMVLFDFSGPAGGHPKFPICPI